MRADVVYSCSDYYAKLAGISILSLIKNNMKLDIYIHIFSDNISEKNKLKLTNTVQKYNKQIAFYNITPYLRLLQKQTTAYNGGYAPFAKFFTFKILGHLNLERVLYIDCDTLIVDSIKDLFFSFDMGDKAIAVSSDCIRKEYRSFLGLTENTIIYATGIVLFNLNQWEKRNCFSRLLIELKKNRKYPLADLDLINITLQDDIIKYPIRFQIISQFLLYSYRDIFYVFDIPKNSFTQEEYNEIFSTPVIYHFCGQTFGRPWFSNSKHPVKALYDSYYYESEWKDEKQDTYNWKIEYKIQYILYRCFPKCLAAFIGMLMQRIFILIKYKK